MNTDVTRPLFTKVENTIDIVGSTVLEGKHSSYSINTIDEIAVGGQTRLVRCFDINSGNEYIAKIYSVRNTGENGIREHEYISSIISQYNAYEQTHLLPVIDYGRAEFTIPTGSVEECYVEINPVCDSTLVRVKMDYDVICNKFFPAVTSALSILHSHNIIHRDIKPSSFFVINDTIVLGDYSAACLKNENTDVSYSTVTMNATGTPGYAAPEIAGHLAYITSDAFSLGITVLELYHGRHPISGLRGGLVEFNQALASSRLEYGIGKEHRYFELLVDGLLEYDPNKRFDENTIKTWLDSPDTFNKQFFRSTQKIGYWSFDYFADGKLMCDDIDSLADALLDNWNPTILYRGDVKNSRIVSYLNMVNSPYASIAMDIIEGISYKNLNTINDSAHPYYSDAGLSVLIHTLKSDNAIYWRKKTFTSLLEIGRYIKSCVAVDSDIVDLFNSGVCGYILDNLTYEMDAPVLFQLKETIALIEKLFSDSLSSGDTERLFRFCGFLLTDTARTPNELFEALAIRRNNINSAFLGEMMASDITLAEGINKKFKGISDKTPDSATKTVLYVFEQICTPSYIEIVRKYNCLCGPDAHLIWIKNNLDLYDFSKSDLDLKESIANTVVDESAALEIQSRQFHELEGKVQLLYQHFNNNILLGKLGLSADDRLTITSCHVGAYFEDDTKSPVPHTKGYLNFINNINLEHILFERRKHYVRN